MCAPLFIIHVYYPLPLCAFVPNNLNNERLAEKAEEAQKLVELDGNFIMAKAQEIGSEPEILSRSVNEYLYAKHGIAYNKANKSKFEGDGAAGRSTQEFNDIINRFDSWKRGPP